MDIKQLQYFIAIVNTGNISGAAKKLHISQPPLSAQIHQLENELGCLLFERGPRKIKLTPSGKLLYERANSILSLCIATKKELQDYQIGAQGTLRLGAVSSVSSTSLISWLSNFHQKHPLIHLELFEGNTYQMIEQLNAGLIELAIVRTPFPEQEFSCMYLQKEALFAVGAEHFFRGTQKLLLSIPELKQVPLILYRRWESIVQELFHQHQFDDVPIFCKCDDARTAIHLADHGLGVCIVPHSALSLLKNPSTIFPRNQ